MEQLPNLSRTRAALLAYDEASERFRVEDILRMSQSEAVAALAELERLGEAVGAAYGEDTKDRNDPETCRQCVRPGSRVPPPGAEESFVRRMVRQWEESQC